MLTFAKLLLVTATLLQLAWRGLAAENVTWMPRLLDQDDDLPRPTPLSGMELRAEAFKGRHKVAVGSSVEMDPPSSTKKTSRTKFVTDRGAYFKLVCLEYADDSFTLYTRAKHQRNMFTQTSGHIETTTGHHVLVLIFKNPDKKESKMKCTATAFKDATTSDATAGSCTCGEVASSRIVGGTEVVGRQVPWIVELKTTTNQGSYSCGGTLVGPRHVLTAAHCTMMKGQYLKSVTVRYGANSLTSDDMTEVAVREVINHPFYNPSPRKLSHDIAMLELASDITFDADVAPACLPDASVTYGGMTSTQSGWGLMADGTSPDNLMTVDLPLGTDAYCTENAGRKYNNDYMICNEFTLDKDSCNGDSGGPVTVAVSDKNYLVGAVSHGPTPCGKSATGVNTRITAYLEWVKIKMTENGDMFCA